MSSILRKMNPRASKCRVACGVAVLVRRTCSGLKCRLAWNLQDIGSLSFSWQAWHFCTFLNLWQVWVDMRGSSGGKFCRESAKEMILILYPSCLVIDPCIPVVTIYLTISDIADCFTSTFRYAEILSWGRESKEPPKHLWPYTLRLWNDSYV